MLLDSFIQGSNIVTIPKVLINNLGLNTAMVFITSLRTAQLNKWTEWMQFTVPTDAPAYNVGTSWTEVTGLSTRHGLQNSLDSLYVKISKAENPIDYFEDSYIGVCYRANNKMYYQLNRKLVDFIVALMLQTNVEIEFNKGRLVIDGVEQVDKLNSLLLLQQQRYGLAVASAKPEPYVVEVSGDGELTVRAVQDNRIYRTEIVEDTTQVEEAVSAKDALTEDVTEFFEFWESLKFTRPAVPQRTKSQVAQVKRRLKEPMFKDNYREQLTQIRAVEPEWFSLSWFIESAKGIEKMAEGRYDWLKRKDEPKLSYPTIDRIFDNFKECKATTVPKYKALIAKWRSSSNVKERFAGFTLAILAKYNGGEQQIDNGINNVLRMNDTQFRSALFPAYERAKEKFDPNKIMTTTQQ